MSAVGCAKAPADTLSLASRLHTNGAPKQYPVHAYLVVAVPYFSLTAAVHFGVISLAKVKCLVRQAVKSKPSGRGSDLFWRYLEMGSWKKKRKSENCGRAHTRENEKKKVTYIPKVVHAQREKACVGETIHEKLRVA